MLLHEESPSPIEQNNGYRRPRVTLGTVQQRYTAAFAVRVERRGKSSPIAWKHCDPVNPIRGNTDRLGLLGLSFRRVARAAE